MVGVSPTVIRELKRPKRRNILPGFTINGYVVWEVYYRSITSDIFNGFGRTKVLLLQ